MINKVLQNPKKTFYKYVLVDLDDVTIIIDRLGRKIKKLLKDSRIQDEPVMYAFSSQPSENILNNCKRAGFQFFEKPYKADQFELLRHMADNDNEGRE